MKHLILLCDYGMDDAVATVALLMHKEKFSGFDILPVGGNVPERDAFYNAQKLLANYPGNIDGVRIIDTSDIKQPCEFLDDIHGGDGMGFLFERPEVCPVPVLKYGEWIETVCADDSVLVSVGPCTVTEMILKKAGEMPLVLMGDHVREEPNYKIYEFNYGINPKAFDYCLKIPHVCATLDTCHIDILNYYDKTPMIDPFMFKLAETLRLLDRARDFKYACIYDYIAVCYLIFPERYITEEVTDPFGNKVTQLKYISDEALIM